MGLHGGEKRMSTLKVIGVEQPWKEKQKSSELFVRKCSLKAMGVLSKSCRAPDESSVVFALPSSGGREN